MTRSDLLNNQKKTEYPLPIRVLLSASPVAFVMLPLLWLTGYPAWEWPFVCGVFTLSLFGSGTLTGLAALLSTKLVYGYARSVAAKLGIDPEQPESETRTSTGTRFVFVGVIVLLLAMTSWGLALYVLGLVMEQTGMAPIGTHFLPIALAMLVIGLTGFTFITGGLAVFFCAVDCRPQNVSRFSRAIRNWTNIAAEMGNRWRVPGAPTLTGRMV